MKEIIIKGDFEVSGDLPSLDKTGKRFQYLKIGLRELPIAFVKEFKNLENQKTKCLNNSKTIK